MRNAFRSLPGFTLIELLIVVAIIAILAAIAVPNFLEAQTRSKVSRAKADMRTIATGLESYYVDWNKYPRSYIGSSAINPRLLRFIPLTTPVAYLTSVPLDVFNREVNSGGADELVQAFIYVDRRTYAEGVPQALVPNSPNGQNLYANLFVLEYPAAQWFLRSRGPLGVGTSAVGANLGNIVNSEDAYDPTNGTVSRGNIFLVGPGVGFLGS